MTLTDQFSLGRFVGSVLLIAAIEFGCAQNGDAAPCSNVLQQVASIDLVAGTNGTPLAPARINDTDRLLLLQLVGGSVVTERVAGALGLTTRRRPGIWSVTLGQWSDRTTSISVGLGGVYYRDMDVFVIPQPDQFDARTEGVLGLDLLNQFDAELDLKQSKLKLFSPEHCPGLGPYWSRAFSSLPMNSDRIGNFWVPMQLDSKDVRVAFNLAQSHAVMSFDTAESKFGLTPGGPGVTPVTGDLLAGNVPITHEHTFDGLSADGIQISNIEVLLAASEGRSGCRRRPRCYGENQDLILGLSEISRMRLYFAFKEKRVYITSADAN